MDHRRHFNFELFSPHYIDLFLFKDLQNAPELLTKLQNMELEVSFINPSLVN